MKRINLNINESKDAYFYVNLKGKIAYKVGNKSGTNKVTAWWIKGPFGSIEHIPELYGQGIIDIKGVLWGKLRVGNADSETVIYISEETEAGFSFPKITFP